MIHSRYWNEVNGSICMPLKIEGIAISTMVMSIDAMSMPMVVLESATHLY
jgi:hypothetical protein